MYHNIVALILLLLASLPQAMAEGQPASTADVAKAIDQHILSQLQAESVQPAPLIDDLAYLRRLTLDIAGRVPTVQEQADYLNLPEATRRSSVVEVFLAQPDFAFRRNDSGW